MLRNFVTPKQYGQRFVVSLIPGDGVGREVCGAVKQIFAKANVPVDWDEVNVSGYDGQQEKPGNGRLLQVIESLKRNGIGLKGTFYTPKERGLHQSFNLAIRKALNMYANVVRVRTLPGIPTRHRQALDFVIIRENTEGEYSNLEHVPQPGVVESLKICTRAKSEAIIRFAFDYARLHGRKKITCVQKANIMKLTDGLFLKVFREVACDYKHAELQLEEMIVDNAAMQLVLKPGQFDVIVAPNLYGNIISNIGAGLVGSAGMLPGYSMGPGCATFEPGARHVAKELEGKDAANPISMILSSALMLRHLGLEAHAEGIEQAVEQVTGEAKVLTADLPGGKARMSDFVRAVLERL